MSGQQQRKFNCNLCNKSFATQEALKQHRGSVHSGARPKQGAVNTSSHLSGVDLVSTVVVTSQMQVGAELLLVPVRPALFEGTRWAALSAPWGRWRPRSLRLEVTSSAPTTIGGQYLVGWTSTSPKPFVGLHGEDVVRSAMSVQSARTADIHKSVSFVLPAEMPVKWYEKSAGSDHVHGVIFMYLVSPVVGSVQGSVQLIIKLHWSCEYELPVLSTVTPSSVFNMDHVAANTEGFVYLTYRNSFTGGLNGKYVCHPKVQGQYLHLYGAKRGYIYKIVGEPLTVSASGLSFEYYVRPRSGNDSISQPAMLAAESLEGARRYLSEGDLSGLASYQEEGNSDARVPLAFLPIEKVSLSEGVTRAAAVKAAQLQHMLLQGMDLEEALKAMRPVTLSVQDKKVSDEVASVGEELASTLDRVPGGKAVQTLVLDPTKSSRFTSPGAIVKKLSGSRNS